MSTEVVMSDEGCVNVEIRETGTGEPLGKLEVADALLRRALAALPADRIRAVLPKGWNPPRGTLDALSDSDTIYALSHRVDELVALLHGLAEAAKAALRDPSRSTPLVEHDLGAAIQRAEQAIREPIHTENWQARFWEIVDACGVAISRSAAGDRASREVRAKLEVMRQAQREASPVVWGRHGELLGRSFDFWFNVQAVLESHCISNTEQLDIMLHERLSKLRESQEPRWALNFIQGIIAPKLSKVLSPREVADRVHRLWKDFRDMQRQRDSSINAERAWEAALSEATGDKYNQPAGVKLCTDELRAQIDALEERLADVEDAFLPDIHSAQRRGESNAETLVRLTNEWHQLANGFTASFPGKHPIDVALHVKHLEQENARVIQRANEINAEAEKLRKQRDGLDDELSEAQKRIAELERERDEQDAGRNHWQRRAMAAEEALAIVTGGQPIPMRLPCPSCGELHIDEGEFAARVHHTHACQKCGAVWRPAVNATVGVRFLPGFKNPEPEMCEAHGSPLDVCAPAHR